MTKIVIGASDAQYIEMEILCDHDCDKLIMIHTKMISNFYFATLTIGSL